MDPQQWMDSCFYGTVRVGERGQIVIPAEARQMLDIQPGDKLIICKDPKVDNLMVAKVNALQQVVGYLSAMIEQAMKVQQDEEAGEETP